MKISLKNWSSCIALNLKHFKTFLGPVSFTVFTERLILANEFARTFILSEIASFFWFYKNLQKTTVVSNQITNHAQIKMIESKTVFGNYSLHFYLPVHIDKHSNILLFNAQKKNVNLAFYEPASYFSLFILMTTLIIIHI